MRLPNARLTEAAIVEPLFEYDCRQYVVMRPLQEEIWAQLRLLTLEPIAQEQVRRRHPRRSARLRHQWASIVQACVDQAYDLFWLAEDANPNTAPLLYYYSMMNLAKAYIFLEDPHRLNDRRDLHHGLTAGIELKKTSGFALEHEAVRTQRGIFPILYSLLTGAKLSNNVHLEISELLRYCTWIGMEMDEVMGDPCRLVTLELQVVTACSLDNIWFRGWIDDSAVKDICPRWLDFQNSAPEFLSIFHRVRSERDGFMQFESEMRACDKTVRSRAKVFHELHSSLRSLRLYRLIAPPGNDLVGEYRLPLHSRGHPPLPEPCVMLAIAFYLSSICRYQPHLYQVLGGTPEAWVLESFLRQSPVMYALVMLDHFFRQEHLFQRS